MLTQWECSGQEHWDDLQDYFDDGLSKELMNP